MTGKHIAEIQEKLLPVWRAHAEIKFVYLFGSWAREFDADYPPRDLDLALYASLSPETLVDWKIELYGQISDALLVNEIDLIYLNSSDNLMLLDEIVREGVAIYDIEPELRKEFDVRIWHDAIDFKEHRRRFAGI